MLLKPKKSANNECINGNTNVNAFITSSDIKSSKWQPDRNERLCCDGIFKFNRFHRCCERLNKPPKSRLIPKRQRNINCPDKIGINQIQFCRLRASHNKPVACFAPEKNLNIFFAVPLNNHKIFHRHLLPSNKFQLKITKLKTPSNGGDLL